MLSILPQSVTSVSYSTLLLRRNFRRHGIDNSSITNHSGVNSVMWILWVRACSILYSQCVPFTQLIKIPTQLTTAFKTSLSINYLEWFGFHGNNKILFYRPLKFSVQIAEIVCKHAVLCSYDIAEMNRRGNVGLH